MFVFFFSFFLLEIFFKMIFKTNKGYGSLQSEISSGLREKLKKLDTYNAHSHA